MKSPGKILYVDDEAMSLKYFERLVKPLAPVLTAASVEEGKAVLQAQGDEIAVLVSDQRMPGAHGNELLRYARETHPSIVRMLTTAYSELGEAIEAINAGEIYRYVTKPWDIESLRADLKNALELAELRRERDDLVREKLMVQQQQLLASRVAHLAVACGGFVRPDFAAGLDAYLATVLALGCPPPSIDWHSLDHADLMQLESERAVAIGRGLAEWQPRFAGEPGAAWRALGEALAGAARVEGEALHLSDPATVTWPLGGATRDTPTPAQLAWLAWQLAQSSQQQGTRVTADGAGWRIERDALPAPSPDWMAVAIERLR